LWWCFFGDDAEHINYDNCCRQCNTNCDSCEHTCDNCCDNFGEFCSSIVECCTQCDCDNDD
jgi:hypothetical protein